MQHEVRAGEATGNTSAQNWQQNKSWKPVNTVQCTRDSTPAWRLHGHISDVQGASQQIHEDSQGCSSHHLNPHRDKQHYSGACKDRASGVSPNCHTRWERALVGSQGGRKWRRPRTPPQSISQNDPGHTEHDPAGCPNERVRACTGTWNLGSQATAIRSENRKRME